ncbi:MAG: DEAD/DEAH box helicase [Magnetococcales bacterium]|nr:DEAD/DEAH box helicase [Magnetococcales bacterium]
MTVSTCQIIPGEIIIPRGYGRRLHELAEATGNPITWRDDRVMALAAYPDRLSGVELRPYQQRILSGTQDPTQGVIVSPTGSGKTITALELIRRRSQRAAVLVHSQSLADQWRKVIMEKMNIQAGMIGGGAWTVGREITVAMMQTLTARPEKARQFAALVGMVIVDECHHAPAGTFAEVIGMFPARFRYGFTATPERGDGLEGMVYRLLGDVVATVLPEEVQGLGGIVQARIDVVDTGCRFPHVDPQKKNTWTALLEALVADQARNRQISRLAISLAQHRQTLVLTDRVEHAESLASLIPGALLIHGKIPAKERAQRMGMMTTARVVVGTKGLLGEGLDCSVWSALILASPMSGATPLLQAVGRVIRPAPGKKDGLVLDLVDAHPYTLGMYRKRAMVYRQRQWPVRKVAA